VPNNITFDVKHQNVVVRTMTDACLGDAGLNLGSETGYPN
jgi:hypothetical protein